jgi:hypothetical protein
VYDTDTTNPVPDFPVDWGSEMPVLPATPDYQCKRRIFIPMQCPYLPTTDLGPSKAGSRAMNVRVVTPAIGWGFVQPVSVLPQIVDSINASSENLASVDFSTAIGAITLTGMDPQTGRRSPMYGNPAKRTPARTGHNNRENLPEYSGVCDNAPSDHLGRTIRKRVVQANIINSAVYKHHCRGLCPQC